MKRSTMIAVAVTAIVLVIAGNAPRLPWDDAARLWRTRVLASATPWPVRLPRVGVPHVAPPHFAVPALRVPPLVLPRLTAPRLPLAAVPYALATAAACAIGALVVLAYGSVRRRRRRSVRLRVQRLAREGGTTAGISRAMRVPKDAVRTVLTGAYEISRAR